MKTTEKRETMKAVRQYTNYLMKNYLDSVTDKDKSIREDILNQMLKDYNDSLIVKPGDNYTRVFVRGSIHSFVIMQDNGKFKRGDILRPVTKLEPDITFVHGNVLNEKYSNQISWSGV